MQASSDTATGISRARLYVGDLRAVLPGLGKDIAQAVITSPPYWGLRDYGLEPQVWGGDMEHEHEWSLEQGMGKSGGLSEKQVTNVGAWYAPTLHGFCACGAWLGSLGLEPTPELYVEHIVEAFRAVRLALRPSGLLWLNLGDSYAGSGKGPSNSVQPDASQIGPSARKKRGLNNLQDTPTQWIPINGASIGSRIDSQHGDSGHTSGVRPPPGYKPKDLIGIPWMVAFALRADGWYLRMDCIWHKPNPMPESVTDRPTRSHEYVFLFSKSRTYYYDANAISEPAAESTQERAYLGKRPLSDRQRVLIAEGMHGATDSLRVYDRDTRNKRSVWTIATQPFPGAHFATFPASLVEDPIKASTRPGDVVLDPFCGAGTVGLVAARLGRDFIGIDLKASYVQMAQRRILDDAPMLNEVTI